MDNVSTVSQLPDELLEAIFIVCVHSVEIPPVVLSQVCKLWRDIAHRSARLWTTIDLIAPERAKHYFELSQGAQLNISWSNDAYSVVTTSTRDWIWAHASRFYELNLVSPTGVLDHIVTQIGDNLSALSSCILIAANDFLVHPAPISFNLTMPCLRRLTLVCIAMSMSDFFGVLQSSPLLEELDISSPPFKLSHSQLSRLQNTGSQAVEQLYLTSLRQIEFKFLTTIEQAYIFMHLRLPVSCSLHLSGFSSWHSDGWRDILNPLATRHLGSLAFSTFELSSGYIKLVREPTEEQYALSWTIINTESIEAFIDIRTLDTSRLYRVEIDSTAYPELGTTLRRLFDSVPATKTLVLHKTSTELLPRACIMLPQLQKVELVDVNLDDITEGQLTACIADTLRASFRWRKEQGSARFCPVEQLILRRCNYTPRSLEILQGEAKFVIT